MLSRRQSKRRLRLCQKESGLYWSHPKGRGASMMRCAASTLDGRANPRDPKMGIESRGQASPGAFSAARAPEFGLLSPALVDRIGSRPVRRLLSGGSCPGREAEPQQQAQGERRKYQNVHQQRHAWFPIPVEGRRAPRGGSALSSALERPTAPYTCDREPEVVVRGPASAGGKLPLAY